MIPCKSLLHSVTHTHTKPPSSTCHQTKRFIQMANRMPMYYSVAELSRRLWWISFHSKLVPKAFHSDNTKENPFMKKCADKIARLQGCSVENAQIQAEKSITPIPKCVIQQKFSGSQSYLSNEQTSNNTFTKVSQKSLGNIVKLELLKDKTAEEVESIWKQYFRGKDGLYAVVPAAAYHVIISKSEEFPIFLYPIPKQPGYEFVLGQFKGNCCYFTPLQDYQMRKDNAQVSLIITYYQELIDEKGIVLMRGEFDDKIMTIQEAQCLANQLQMYYGGNNVKKEKLLFQFNKEPHKFHFMDLIFELETGLG